ncbi:MAG TPA: hypothetical protein VF624_02685 [Tepidisphaeraceae bacterium]|jgi:60 kDa SS-A/Ro ribonucleoprotein
MANKNLFKSIVGKLLPRADIVNEAGGAAYAMAADHMLAQYAATGCLNSTFYATDAEQLAGVLRLCEGAAPEFIARTAIYARREASMKDLPALLCATLAARSPGLLAEVFDRVIDDARMLRNFVQIVRSGVTGRKSLGTLPKRLVQQWLEGRSDDALFRASVGRDPSLADVIKMVHPKPATPARAALYAYLIGREHDASLLPALVRQYEAFKADLSKTVPDVPFQLLSSLPLQARHWKAIARQAPWQATRMNLNTFARHGVFEGEDGADLTRCVADRLRDKAALRRSRVFPYQVMVAYAQCDATVPAAVRDALQDAMEISVANVPRVAGRVYVCPDVSGSMQSPVTGYRRGSTSVVKCVDVAALVAAAVLRANAEAEVLPFESDVVKIDLNRRDSVMTNARRLSSLPAGGTNCSAPLRALNERKARGELVIYVSDNESWIDSPTHGRFGGSATATMREWAAFKARNPAAKLVCIDIQPTGSTQASERSDVLNIGGFNDRVFDVIAKFADGTLAADHWAGVIGAIEL